MKSSSIGEMTKKNENLQSEIVSCAHSIEFDKKEKYRL